jgi:hypothetical protein
MTSRPIIVYVYIYINLIALYFKAHDVSYSKHSAHARGNSGTTGSLICSNIFKSIVISLTACKMSVIRVGLAQTSVPIIIVCGGDRYICDLSHCKEQMWLFDILICLTIPSR